VPAGTRLVWTSLACTVMAGRSHAGGRGRVARPRFRRRPDQVEPRLRSVSVAAYWPGGAPLADAGSLGLLDGSRNAAS